LAEVKRQTSGEIDLAARQWVGLDQDGRDLWDGGGKNGGSNGCGGFSVLSVNGLLVEKGFAGRLQAVVSRIQPARILNHKWLFLYPERAVDDAWGVIRRSFQKKRDNAHQIISQSLNSDPIHTEYS
jgi:hypothetical protein